MWGMLERSAVVVACATPGYRSTAALEEAKAVGLRSPELEARAGSRGRD